MLTSTVSIASGTPGIQGIISFEGVSVEMMGVTGHTPVLMVDKCAVQRVILINPTWIILVVRAVGFLADPTLLFVLVASTLSNASRPTNVVLGRRGTELSVRAFRIERCHTHVIRAANYVAIGVI